MAEVRGLAQLFVLQNLMYRIQAKERLRLLPRPCEWFDLIVGTSTGGLIALMLGRIKMTVDATIDAYQYLEGEVFAEDTKSWLSTNDPVFSDPTYSGEKLEAAIRKIVQDAELDIDADLADPEAEPQCRVAVVATRQGAVTPAAGYFPDLLRTYTLTEPPYSCTILDAAKATCAASTFFPPVKVQIRRGRKVKYLAGWGTSTQPGYNNPTGLAVREVEQIWGADYNLACVVSVGTGV
jgi:patatin-like phospholipase/acyl hydrolase